MKTKFLIFLLILGLLSIYPVYRYVSHAKVFANAVFGHVSKMGNWNYGTISSSFGGKITIRNVSFTPKNYSQGFSIDSIVIKTVPMFLLKTSAEKLSYILPETMSLSINSASLNKKSNDVFEEMKRKDFWMMLAGFAGSFGCTKDQYTSFDDEVLAKLINSDQIYNADLYFARQTDSSLDLDVILDAEDRFSSTWSSNLKSSYSEDEIVLDELLVEKLYYSYLDNGFNLARNNACKENYNSSFAAYRLSSADHVQRFMRVNFSKEFPKALINWYQRILAPDTETNSIITLDKRMYLSDVFNSDQIDLLKNSKVEISIIQNEYIPVALEEIDFTTIDSRAIISENIKKQKQIQEQKRQNQELIAKNKASKQNKTKITRMGSSKKRTIDVRNISSVVNKRIRIKTIQGRPISGILTQVNDGMITLDSQFKTGKSTLTIPVDKISLVELL